jgi:hypothetical protein
MGVGANLMSKDRHRAQFGLHCIFNANMLMTGNLSALDPFVLATWGNPEAVAINQDTSHTFIQLPFEGAAAAAPGARDLTPARVAECGGEPAAQNWTFGAPAAGYLSNAANRVCLNAANCATQLIYDGCVTSGRTCNPPGTFFNEQFALEPSGALVSAMKGAPCATVAADGTVALAPCGSPPGPTQKWRYTPASGELALEADGRCLTVTAPAPQWESLLVGRQLADNSWALLALNNANGTAPLACGAPCVAAMGFPAGATFKVRDVWARTDLPPTAELLLPAPANGGSAFWRVSLA